MRLKVYGTLHYNSRKYQLTKLKTRIGSSVTADIRILDDGMHRNHAEIHFMMNRCLTNTSRQHLPVLKVFTDQTKCPMFVNNRLVTGSTILSNKDSITIGLNRKHCLEFFEGELSPRVDALNTPSVINEISKCLKRKLLNEFDHFDQDDHLKNSKTSTECTVTPSPYVKRFIEKSSPLTPKYSPSIRKFFLQINKKSSQIMEKIEIIFNSTKRNNIKSTQLFALESNTNECNDILAVDSDVDKTSFDQFNRSIHSDKSPFVNKQPVEKSVSLNVENDFDKSIDSVMSLCQKSLPQSDSLTIDETKQEVVQPKLEDKVQSKGRVEEQQSVDKDSIKTPILETLKLENAQQDACIENISIDSDDYQESPSTENISLLEQEKVQKSSPTPMIHLVEQAKVEQANDSDTLSIDSEEYKESPTAPIINLSEQKVCLNSEEISLSENSDTHNKSPSEQIVDESDAFKVDQQNDSFKQNLIQCPQCDKSNLIMKRKQHRSHSVESHLNTVRYLFRAKTPRANYQTHVQYIRNIFQHHQLESPKRDSIKLNDLFDNIKQPSPLHAYPYLSSLSKLFQHKTPLADYDKYIDGLPLLDHLDSKSNSQSVQECWEPDSMSKLSMSFNMSKSSGIVESSEVTSEESLKSQDRNFQMKMILEKSNSDRNEKSIENEEPVKEMVSLEKTRSTDTLQTMKRSFTKQSTKARKFAEQIKSIEISKSLEKEKVLEKSKSVDLKMTESMKSETSSDNSISFDITNSLKNGQILEKLKLNKVSTSPERQASIQKSKSIVKLKKSKRKNSIEKEKPLRKTNPMFGSEALKKVITRAVYNLRKRTRELPKYPPRGQNKQKECDGVEGEGQTVKKALRARAKDKIVRKQANIKKPKVNAIVSDNDDSEQVDHNILTNNCDSIELDVNSPTWPKTKLKTKKRKKKFKPKYDEQLIDMIQDLY